MSLFRQRRLIKLQEVDSTHLVALRMLENHTVDDDVIITAKKQTAGIGRCNRAWSSTSNNLFMSMITKIPDIKNELSIVVACSLHNVISQYIARNTKNLLLHWPNDIHYDRKKLSGILIASFNDWFVISIGVDIYPVQELDTAISLREISPDIIIDPVKLLRQIEFSIDKWVELDFFDVRSYWIRNASDIGQQIVIKNGQDSLSGIYRGIDETGKLVLAVGDKTVFISSGDMFKNMDKIMVKHEEKR